MAEQNALIAALRANTPAAQTSNPGFTFFDLGTDGSFRPVEPERSAAERVNSQFAGSKFFDSQEPFLAGQALNEQYNDIYAQETGNNLMDLSRYGGRYANELSTPGGRRVFNTDVGFVQNNQGGFYREGDLDPLAGLEDLQDPVVKKNYATLFDNGNSYFIPDAIEANPYQYNYHLFTADKMSKPQQDASFERMYSGQNLANNAAFKAGALSEGTVNPEALMRETLNASARNGAQPGALAQALRSSSGVLAGMDVGRGNISYEQGAAIDKALQFQGYLDTSANQVRSLEQSIANLQNELANLSVDRGNTDTYNQNKAALEGRIQSEMANLEFQRNALARNQEALNPYLATVRTIKDPNVLSSAEVIRLLRL